MCYVFLRLHHTLFMRLTEARKLAQEAASHNSSSSGVTSGDHPLAVLSSPSSSLTHQAGQESLERREGRSMSFTANDPSSDTNNTSSSNSSNDSLVASSKGIYNHFLGQVFSLIEGSIDNGRFEEFTRNLLGNKAYILYSLDKIISQMMKHLQAMANDDNVTKLIGLFVYHHNHLVGGGANSGKENEEVERKGVDPVLYRNHVAYILSHTMEEVFRIQVSSSNCCRDSSSFLFSLSFLPFSFLFPLAFL
jgi:histone deacetylase complex regulatory component SIN3